MQPKKNDTQRTMATNNENNFLELLSSFLIGVASSTLVAWIIYKKQQKDTDKFQKELTLTLLNVLKQGEDINQHIQEISDSVNSQGSKTDDSMKFLISEYSKTDKLLKSKSIHKEKSKYVDSVLRYKIIADKISEEYANKKTGSVLENDGKLNIENIKKLHFSIFPEGYTWAGKLRTDMVKIISSANVSGRIIDPMISSITIDVVRPESITEKLDLLISSWNSKISIVENYDIDAKCQELAYFHQEFLLIHPFIDGNGRVSRMILNDQASFLFKTDIKINFDSDREQYYQSLRLADLRQITQLSDLIKKRIREIIGSN